MTALHCLTLIIIAYSCENDIENRVQSLQSEIDLAEKSLREQLDKMCTEMADTIGESEGLQLRDIRFLASDLSSSSSGSNILGYLSVDGLLPSHLSLSLSSKLSDLKPGGSVIMSVEPDTGREVAAGWDKKVVIQVAFTSTEGRQEILRLKKKMEEGKRLLKFNTPSAGVYSVSATLYEEHVVNSPFVIPVGENLLQSIGLCHLEEKEKEESFPSIARADPERVNEDVDKVEKDVTTTEAVGAPLLSPRSLEVHMNEGEGTTTTSSTSTLLRDGSDANVLDVRKKEETSPAPAGPCVDSLAFTGRTVQVRIEGVLSPAVIDKKISDDLYIVKMIKSNSFMGVHPSDMILEEKDAWPVGAMCLARWSEDSVWYRAQVVECLAWANYKVLFTDYGNQDLVTAEDMVTSADQIPDGAYIDEFVQKTVGTAEERTELEPEKEKKVCHEEDSFSSSILGRSGNFKTGNLDFSATTWNGMKMIKTIDAGSSVSKMALLGTETLLCLLDYPREIQLFNIKTGQKKGILKHPHLLSPRDILVLGSGGVVVSDDGLSGGVHIFDQNLQYLDFMSISGSTVITGLCEGPDSNIVSLNVTESDTFLLFTPVFGESIETKLLTNMIQLQQSIGLAQSGLASALPESQCSFVISRNDGIYVVGRFSNRISAF